MVGSPRWPRRWLGLAVLGALLLACAAPAAAPAPTSAPAPALTAPPASAPPTVAAREPRTLQAAVQGLAGFFYPMWVAQQKGLLREQGLEVEWSTLGTNEAIPALLGGSLDILNASTDAAVTALSKGAALKLVADYSIITPYEMVARPEVASMAALRGQKVGASSLRAGQRHDRALHDEGVRPGRRRLRADPGRWQSAALRGAAIGRRGGRDHHRPGQLPRAAGRLPHPGCLRRPGPRVLAG